MALAILIFRNLTKLFFERRRRVIGARLRTRLAVAFVGLASLPALLLFLVSLKLITTSVQGWFDVRVEDALRLAADLAADAPRSTERTALGQAQRLAEEIARLDLAGPGQREIRARHLRGRVQELGLAAVAYYGGPGRAGPADRLPRHAGLGAAAAARAPPRRLGRPQRALDRQRPRRRHRPGLLAGAAGHRPSRARRRHREPLRARGAARAPRGRRGDLRELPAGPAFPPRRSG